MKTVLITGAASGLGWAMAQQFYQRGDCVWLVDRDAEGLQQRSAALGNERVHTVVADLADAAAIDAVAQAITASGRLDILVNNAGITKDNIMMRMKEEEWFDVIDTNLNSLYRIAKASLRGMTKARWGRIINISSVVGSMGNAGQANYAAAKAGMDGFTRALAREIGSRGITVNSVAPGFIDTDMTKKLPDEQRDALKGQIPLQRLGEPEEIASVVAFLAGDAGGYITGETIHVNGGMYMA